MLTAESPSRPTAHMAETNPDREVPESRVAYAQIAYYMATGVWPLVSPRSFQAVTGRKHDFWLAQTAGVLIAVTGLTLAVASREGSLRSATARTLAIGSAAGLAAVDVVFVARRRISPIYLADAVAELGIVAGWLAARSRTRGREYEATRPQPSKSTRSAGHDRAT